MRQALVRDAAKNAVRTHIGGRRVAILSREDLISDVAEVLRDEVDIVIGFAYVQSGDRVSLKWSLRSRGDVDVAAIAERHGGGGHTAAAGFHEVIIGDGHMAHMANPYARAEVLFA
jgi:nanoRNase/pAp phosphatase (c-di-AMP/oligoRNAs hydrolase)